MDLTKRIDRVLKVLERTGADALLVAKPVNIRYLTGLRLDGSKVIIGRKKCRIITSFLYKETAKAAPAKYRLTVQDSDGEEEVLAKIIKDDGIKNLAFENSMSFNAAVTLRKRCRGIHTQPACGIVESVRALKEENEIRKIRHAVRITKAAFETAKKKLNTKSRESELVNLIKREFLRMGGDGPAFEPIVAGQPSACQPHYFSKAKKIGINNSVLIDMGANFRGYNSDLTRVVSLGRISSKFKYIYSVVRDAQKSALESLRPGIKACKVDNKARKYIEKKGFGRYFGHALGHGVGLEIHEKPVISGKSKDVLKPGMVFTIEPGIYIPGFGGVRIEDMILVKKGGYEVITDDIDK